MSAPGAGVFSIDNAGYWTSMNHLIEPANSRMRAAMYYAIKAQTEMPRKALFSSQGTERMVEIRDGVAEGFLWFPQKFSVDFFVPRELITQDWWQTKKYARGRSYCIF